MNLIHYLLEANLYLIAFYLFYIVILRSETFYQLNRVYLLITTLLAFIVPTIQVGYLKPAITPITEASKVVNESLTSVTIVPSTNIVIQPWTAIDYTLTTYAIVCTALLLLLVFRISKLFLLAKKGITKRQRGFTLVELPGDNVAFSFFGFMFINKHFVTSQTILLHEEVHIRQKHSWDVIYFELIKIINWFNPIVYLLQKSLKEVHEFIADEQVALTESNRSAYADFLISNAYGLTQNQLTNLFFNKNLLKRRIIMLYQKKLGNAARLKYLLTVPLAGGLLCISTLTFANKGYVWADIAPKQEINDVNVQPKSYSNAQPTLPYKDIVVLNSAKTDILQTNMETYPKENDTLSKKTDKLNAAIAKTILTQLDKIGFVAGNKSTDSTSNNPGIANRDDFKEFNRYMSIHIRYPNVAKDNYIQGRVVITFTVDQDKNIQNLLVLEAPDQSLSNEASRALISVGKLTNAKINVTYTVPIDFKINFDDFKTDPPKPINAKAVYNKKVMNSNEAYMLDEIVVVCYSKLPK